MCVFICVEIREDTNTVRLRKIMREYGILRSKRGMNMMHGGVRRDEMSWARDIGFGTRWWSAQEGKEERERERH